MMQFTARQFTPETAALIPDAAKAIRMRLMKPQRTTQRVESIEAPTIHIGVVWRPEPSITRLHGYPTPLQIANEPKQHVKAYRQWMIYLRSPAPISFVKLQCAIEGISYETLIGHKNARLLGPTRKAIVNRTKERFPNLTAPSLALLFHRDSSTILYALGRLTKCKARRE